MGWWSKTWKKINKWVAPVVGVIVGVVAIATGFGLITALVAGAAAAAVTQAGIGMVTSAFDVPDYSSNTADGASAINSGILVNKVGTNNPIPVVYGKRKVGGSRVFVSTNGTDNKDLYIAIVFCEGEINAFKELYLDDKLVASGDLTTQIQNTAYSNESRLQYELQKGTAGQTPPSFFTTGASSWTAANHKLSGLAVGYFRCRWVRPATDATSEAAQKTIDDNPYGGIPIIQVVIEGKKTPVATSYVDGETDTYASMAKVYSTNPADHMLDYLMNDIFGRGLANDRIGFTSFKVASIKFDTTVTYQKGGTGKILENNMVIDTGRTMLENVQTMLQNMRSGMPYIQGKFNLKLLDTGHASTPGGTPEIAYAVTERELIGGLVIEGLGHRDQYNQIKAVYPDPESNWEVNEVIYPEVGTPTDIALLAEDNGRRLTKDISLEGITNPNLAGDIASVVLLRSRKKKMASFTATAELHDTVVGDIITITYPSLGMSEAQFRITSLHITADYTVQITALEHDPTDYDFTNTDIYIPDPVYISPAVPGNPYFPPAHLENAQITAVSLGLPYSICTASIPPFCITQSVRTTFTINWATDQSQYAKMIIQVGNSGDVTNLPTTNISTLNAVYLPAVFDSTTIDGYTEWTNFGEKYIWYRCIYYKDNGDEVFGSWFAKHNPYLPGNQFNYP